MTKTINFLVCLRNAFILTKQQLGFLNINVFLMVFKLDKIYLFLIYT